METALRIFENNRNVYLRLLESFSLEQLNKIPKGFSNNIVWNIGHIVVTQQILVYKLSGLPLIVSKEMEETYVNGSFPTGKTSQNEVDELKVLLLSSVIKTKEDFGKPDFFINYQPYTTKSTGFTINDALDAIAFNNFHEGVHFGIMLQIKKFI
ncbi:DinB family protein [Flavobacterium sp.]|uniref:DinB family protein n=1 Tax=Flavobacterium sp. TaxID=239 RepID=UPI00286C7496|nr:DinB family protein [Flavobacterium sp.]